MFSFERPEENLRVLNVHEQKCAVIKWVRSEHFSAFLVQNFCKNFRIFYNDACGSLFESFVLEILQSRPRRAEILQSTPFSPIWTPKYLVLRHSERHRRSHEHPFLKIIENPQPIRGHSLCCHLNGLPVITIHMWIINQD